MKLITRIIAAAALTCAFGIADAACPPYAYQQCQAGRANCIANGTNPDICDLRFERCMAQKGCGPIP